MHQYKFKVFRRLGDIVFGLLASLSQLCLFSSGNIRSHTADLSITLSFTMLLHDSAKKFRDTDFVIYFAIVVVRSEDERDAVSIEHLECRYSPVIRHCT